MGVDVSDPSGVAWAVLELVHRLKTKYGKGTLSKILKGSKNRHIQHVVSEAGEGYGCLGLFSLEQVGDLVQQLIDAGYLENLNVGTDYEILVLGLTDKGVEALNQKLPIQLNLPKVYRADFRSGSDVEIIEKEVLDEYYKVKVELAKLVLVSSV